MSPEEAAAELLRRRFARNSLVEFAQAIDVPGKPVSEDPDEWLFEPVETVVAAHHVLLMDTLDKVHTREIRNLMVFMPPGSAKSTYASVVFPTYSMGKRPGAKFILASYASGIAWKQSRRTRQIARSEKFRPIFGCGLTAGNQSVEEWSMDNGSEYMASGLLSGVTGNRATDIIVDDPVAGREEAESPVIRKKTWEAYEDDLLTRLMPGGAQIIIQTRWHEDDLSGRILPENWNGESGTMQGRDGLEWHVLCLPAIADREDDPLGRKIGDPLWPEWFKEGHFERFRGRPRTWSALFQQKPRPTEGAEFQLSWIRKYLTAPKRTNRIILVDPSSGKRKKDGSVDASKDYTSMWVLALGADRNAYLVDGIRDRLNLSQRVSALMDLHRKHSPLQVRYEEYGLQADIEAVEMAQEREQYRFKITKVGGSTPKEDRIRRLVPWFEEGRIYLPHTLPYTDVTGTQHDLVKEFLDQEYAAFPVARHDDMFDSLARLAEPTLKLPFPKAMQDEGQLTEFEPLDNEVGY
jgi:predicted phage terminase large subunit-like protein